MRLRHIEVFHAVYNCGSITGAAKLLNVSQPSISKVLAHAEQQLGFPQPAGRELRESARAAGRGVTAPSEVGAVAALGGDAGVRGAGGEREGGEPGPRPGTRSQPAARTASMPRTAEESQPPRKR